MTASRVDVLKGLLARVRGATGADSYLGLEILMTLGGVKNCGGLWLENTKTKERRRFGAGEFTDPITSSIDAALALVERCLPGWTWEVRKSGFGDSVRAELQDPMQQPGFGARFGEQMNHGHAPLAILAALLLALISSESHQ